jgi:glycosyltransferase involved in cell wall biosynthesis
VWRCWVDASEPDRALFERALPLLDSFSLLAFPATGLAPKELSGPRCRIGTPGIDPLDARNLDPTPGLAGRRVRGLGVDLERPFVCQVLRLDRWSDPHTTIEALALAREELPDLQLVLAALLEPGDEREWRAAKELRDYGGDTPDLRLLTSYEGVTPLEVGALQRLARVCVQPALRDGFDLAPAEALWQRTPVIGNPRPALAAQVRDGVEGVLVEGAPAVAEHIVELVRDVGLAVELGRAGRERVRERFLVAHALEHELNLLAAALQA